LRRTLLLVTTGSLVLVPAATAHVTVNPEQAAAGSFARFSVRVPSERPDASTVEIRMQLPEGLFFVSFQPKPGWKRTVKMEKLSPPAEVFGEEVTERVAEVTWTGGKIGPGEFDEFGMSARVPEEEGAELVFPAIQRYSSGETVRWIGPPDAEQPAPRVTVTPAEEEEQPAANPTTTTEAAPSEGAAAEEGGRDRANLALGFGLAGLVVALIALGLPFARR
jgi:uncharacterized protein YcnI